MKKSFIMISSVAIFFGLIGVGGAVPITFTDTTSFSNSGASPGDLVGYGGNYVNKLEYAGDFLKWVHNFTFTPPAQQVLSGMVTLSLVDDERDTFDPRTWEIALGWGEDKTWKVGEVNTGLYSYDVNASYLKDGAFAITLISLWGDFSINKSDLTITYDPAPAAAVPEPATLLLLGSGILGLGIWKRVRGKR